MRQVTVQPEYSTEQEFGEPAGRGWAPVHLALFALLLLFGLLFVAFSVDIMVRVWHWRGRFDTPVDAAVLLYFEGIRSITTAVGLGVAAFLAVRASKRPGLDWLAWAVALGSIAYTKVIAFRSFPGAAQESIARALRETTTPQWLLDVVFAHPEWAAWLATAPLLLFAARFPRPLTDSDVARSGVHDRVGALRTAGVAGLDIGHAMRRITAAALRGGALRPAAVWSAAALLAAAHTFALRWGSPATDRIVNLLAIAVAAAAAALFITLFRAGARVADTPDGPTFAWLRRGMLAALVLFAGAAAAAALPPARPLGVAAFSLAPLALALCTLLAALHTSPYGPLEGRTQTMAEPAGRAV
jgi:hypothetical protein